MNFARLDNSIDARNVYVNNHNEYGKCIILRTQIREVANISKRLYNNLFLRIDKDTTMKMELEHSGIYKIFISENRKVIIESLKYNDVSKIIFNIKPTHKLKIYVENNNLILSLYKNIESEGDDI